MYNITTVDITTQHDGNFVYDFPNGFDTWLFLLVHTESIFRINGEDRHFPPQSLVLFKPHTPIYYRAVGDSYTDDWMHFMCSENDINDSLFPSGLPIKTPLFDQCHTIFQLITVENYLDNEYKLQTIDSLINALINKLIEAYHISDYSPKPTKLMELRKEIYKSPGENWTLSMMANKVFLSESHLQSLYKKTFNVSCINDVINARIQLAKTLLSYTDYTISYISASCGYNSAQHFFRQFHKVVGCSPNAYRNSLRPGTPKNSP